MNKKKNQKAHVVNGNSNYRHRVFAIRGGSIIKSWDTEVYLRTPLSEIRRQLEVRNRHFRSTPW
jgi:hypothetical protein